MPPRIATIVFAAGIAVLFYLNRDNERRSSPALWIAAAWLFIGSSRMVSQWLAGELVVGQADAYLEGSSSDRLFLSLVLGVALIVLLARADKAGPLLRANAPLLLFFGFCAISILWSDFMYVALKRWTKALGNLTMVVVILTDPQPELAVKRVFARAGFLLIPLSILFIKYYPDLGRYYNRWTWTSSNIGVSTDKNGLGAICLVFGLVSMWRFIDAYFDKTNPSRLRILCAHGAVLAMASWLFVAADSSTSLVCFLLGSALILFTVRPATERPVSVNLIVASIVILPLFLGFAFRDAYSYAVQGLGRNITLTGRTELWADLFRMDLNQWVGTGFESFWLGERAEHFWNKYEFHPNQAHNGYIETYINLGWIGVILFAFVVAAGYRNVLDLYRRDPNAGSIRLCFFIVALIYSLTEAAFKVTHPLWIAFLLSVTALPPLRERKRSPVKIPFAGARAAMAAGATPELPVA